MKQLLRLLVLALPYLFCSCDYSPSGEHFEEIDPNPLVVADLTLAPDQDTIAVRGLQQFSFSISMPGRTVHGYQLKLGGAILATGTRASDTYYFDSAKYGNGYHTLQLSAISNSGTGSLADKSGAEGIEVYRTWVVYIENGPPTPVAVTSVKPEAGSLKVEWQRYSGKFFYKYELLRNLAGNGYDVVATFTDPGQTSWLDPTYVGGQVSYIVNVVAENSSYYNSQSTGASKSYHYPLAHVLQHTYDAANNLTITFSATPFYSNFGSYSLTSMQDLSFSSSEWADTVARFEDPGFGSDFYVKLVAYPKDANKEQYARRLYSQSTVPGYGTAWGPYAEILPRPAADRFYSFVAGDFKVIDAATYQVVQERNIGYQLTEYGYTRTALSQDARHLYTYADGLILKLDPSTLQTLDTYKIGDLLKLNYHSYFKLSLGVSNDNRLLIAAHSYWDYKDTVYVVDMAQKRILYKTKAPYFPANATLSPDGKQFKMYPNLYTEQSGGWQQQPLQNQASITTLAFHPTKPWYYTRSGTTVSFYHASTGSLQKSLNTEAALDSYEVDAASGYLYGVGNGSLYVYNIDTGQLIRKVKLNNSVFVYKDRIFSPNRYIPL